MPRYLTIEGWLGQVGLDSQTVAVGAAIFTSSSAWRTAPVPPGVATAESRSLATVPPSTNSIMAAENSGAPAKPT